MQSENSNNATRDMLLDAAVSVYSKRKTVVVSSILFTILFGLALHYKIGFSTVESVISVPQVDFKTPFLSDELIERKIRGSIVPVVTQKLQIYHNVKISYVDRGAKYLEISTKIPPFRVKEVESIKAFQKELLAQLVVYLKEQTDTANKVYEKVVCEGGKEAKSDKFVYISSPQIVYEGVIEEIRFLSGKIIFMYFAVLILGLLGSVACVFVVEFVAQVKNKHDKALKK